MDSFELNKIIGAILGTLLFVMATGFIAEAIYTPRVTAAQGYDLPEPKQETAQAAAPAPAETPLPVLLASASATRGEAQIKKCEACHNITEGGGAKVGPDLFGVVGRQIAHKDDYPYSSALKAHSGDTWTYANLNKWIDSPSTFAPGTKMTFAGIKDDKDRADLLAYLQTLSHSPVPFPKPEPASTQGGAKAPAAQAAPAANKAAPASAAAAPAATALPALLANASATRGEAQIKKCEACHNITEGGGPKVGPDLFGVVGRQIAHKDDYPYSDALKAHSGDTWTYANLNKWIDSPSTFAPGTKMTFAGIKDDKDRADLLAYLQTLSHSPVPFPKAEPAGTQGGVKPPAEQAAPAENAAAPQTPASGGGAPAGPNVSAPQPSTNASPAAGTTMTTQPPSNANPTTEAQPSQPAGDTQSGNMQSAPSGNMMTTAPQQIAPEEPAQQGGGAQ